jgi:hypothetical protein
MLLWLLGHLFSRPGLVGVGGLLLIGAVGAAWLRLPRPVIWGLAGAAAAYFAVGLIWRAADDACVARVAAEVARIEAEWREAVAEARAALSAELDAAESDRAAAEAALAEFARLVAQRPAAEQCILTQEDADAINSK